MSDPPVCPAPIHALQGKRNHLSTQMQIFPVALLVIVCSNLLTHDVVNHVEHVHMKCAFGGDYGSAVRPGWLNKGKPGTEDSSTPGEPSHSF